jgi:hypothetical protein
VVEDAVAIDPNKVWGFHKFREQWPWKWLRNQAIHASIGAAVGGGLLLVWHVGPFAIVTASAVGATVEVVQFGLSKWEALNIADRTVDWLFYTFGGTLAWLISRLAS